MKDIIIPLLQQRMDKCTNEQFWAVAVLSAADAFFISEGQGRLAAIPTWLALAMLTLGTAYGVLFIIDRHRAYYRNRDAMAKLLEGEPDVPDFMRGPSKLRTFTALSGVSFYVGCVIVGYVLCLFVA
jgi:hypothetical protein